MVKLRLSSRILLILTAVVLLALAGVIVSDVLDGYRISRWAYAFLQRKDWMAFAICALVTFGLIGLGVHAVSLALGLVHGKRYVMVDQKGGNLRISLSAIENLVRKCLSSHEEIDISSIQLSSTKQGLDMILHGDMPIGMDIPGAVSALQSEIKEYVVSCSGVMVREVAVLIDNTRGTVTEPADQVNMNLLQTGTDTEICQEDAVQSAAHVDECSGSPETSDQEIADISEPSEVVDAEVLSEITETE